MGNVFYFCSDKTTIMELQPFDIQNKIYEIRDQRVMLDFDLAEIYEVETRALKQAVRRNMKRFPDDFMFELTMSEYNSLLYSIRSQFVTLDAEGRGKYPKFAPFAFTQEGITMLSSVLRSPVAIDANIKIMRAFVAVRQYILTHASMSIELAQLRERVLMLEQATGDNTEAIRTLYTAIEELSNKQPQLDPNRRMIGFNRGNEQKENV